MTDDKHDELQNSFKIKHNVPKYYKEKMLAKTSKDDYQKLLEEFINSLQNDDASSIASHLVFRNNIDKIAPKYKFDLRIDDKNCELDLFKILMVIAIMNQPKLFL